MNVYVSADDLFAAMEQINSGESVEWEAEDGTIVILVSVVE